MVLWTLARPLGVHKHITRNYCWWLGNLSPNTVFCWLECWLLSKNKWDCIKQQKVNLWVLKTRKYSKKKMCDIRSYIPIIILKCAAIHNYSLLTHWVFVFRCTNPSLHKSPECHCGVDLLCCGIDVVLILHQILHLLLGFLNHVLPALHPVQVPLQRLIEKFGRHEVVLNVARQPVAGGLQRRLGLRDLV